MAASSDDILLIFPYIVLKSGIRKLLQQLKFIRLFSFSRNLSGSS